MPESPRNTPSNKPSDDLLYEEACELLWASPFVDASDIQVTVDDGFITLNGTVIDRGQKRAAEDALKDLSGVNDIFNYLTIDRGRGLIGDANIDLKMI